ncbi:hypothetical protein MNV49_005788 [Pseudohyphozyma bogoriensis]|nr:hypothetical protein MNV49_005788 [Pseudohyphozyma bogoriensis]
MNAEKPKVKRYTCMFTRDRPTKKNKRWEDGAVRVHHFNRSVILLDSEFTAISSAFYTPPPTIATAFDNSDNQGLSPDFIMPEGEEIVFEEGGFLVEVGELEWEGETDLSNIRKRVNESKQKAAEVAKEWANAMDEDTPYRARSSASGVGGRDRTQASTSASTSSPASSSSRTTYKGFSIAPPKSYLDSLAGKSKPKATSFKSSSHTTHSSPYARPLSSSNTSNYPSHTPSRDSRPHTAIPSHLSTSTNSPASTPSDPTIPFSVGASRAASSPFRPPTLKRTAAASPAPTQTGGMRGSGSAYTPTGARHWGSGAGGGMGAGGGKKRDNYLWGGDDEDEV